jgi:lipopolysaccharide/colanic/teichoic acid biosynthesis glycosyltransferase
MAVNAATGSDATTVGPVLPDERGSRVARRVFDVVVSVVGLIVLAVPFAVIAVAVRLSSPGPAIYRQRRIGRGGREFWLYKFRTMRPGEGGMQVTVRGDERVTPLGRRLRPAKLDEFPQLWNVLRGDMSVIGPRPEVERFVRHYTPEQARLLRQTPGLAGLAQLVYPHEADLLSGCADPEAVYLREIMPRKIAIDLQYEAVRTFWSDLRLLGEVVRLLLGRRSRVDPTFWCASVRRAN